MWEETLMAVTLVKLLHSSFPCKTTVEARRNPPQGLLPNFSEWSPFLFYLLVLPQFMPTLLLSFCLLLSSTVTPNWSPLFSLNDTLQCLSSSRKERELCQSSPLVFMLHFPHFALHQIVKSSGPKLFILLVREREEIPQMDLHRVSTVDSHTSYWSSNFP